MSSFIRTIVALFAGIIFLLSAAPVASAAEADANLAKFNISCWQGIDKGINLTGCIAEVVYTLVYVPTGKLLTGSAYVFDALFPLSISSKFIAQDFVATAWGIIRDVANMAFIFILLYVGISTILGMGNDWKGPVFNVIIIALLLNFSLFFTKVIIDAGNIFAVGIYSQMGAESSTPHANQDQTGLPERQLSYALASYFQPQQFMNAVQATEEDGPAQAIFVFVVAAIVSLFVAYVFFKASFLMVGRLLMLWYHMIMSPIAFISIAIPGSHYFSKWLDGLIKQSFFPVIFLFFIYIIITITSKGILDGFVTPGLDKSAIDIIIVVVLKTVLVVMALLKSLSFAESMAGDAGGMAQKWGGKMLGLTAATHVLNPATKLLRATAGRGAEAAFNSDTFRSLATKEAPANANIFQRGLSSVARVTGRGVLATADVGRKATYDPRGLKVVQQATKASGFDLGAAGGKGGWSGTQDKWKKDQIEAAKRTAMTESHPLNLQKGEAEKALKDAKGSSSGDAKKIETTLKQLADELAKDPAIIAEKAAMEASVTAEKELATAMNELAKAEKAYSDAGSVEERLAQGKVRDAAKQNVQVREQTVAEKKEAQSNATNAATGSLSVKSIRDRKEAVEKDERNLKDAQDKFNAAEGAVTAESQRRRNVTADDVESGALFKAVVGGSVATAVTDALVGPAVGAIVGGYVASGYSSKTAKAAADKIRKGTSKEENDKEDLLKKLQKLTEPKAGSGEEAGAGDKGAKGDH